jgi:hypothetical protein
MKKSLLLTLAVSALISSCGQKNNQGASQTYRQGIVLGAFVDITAQDSTFDEAVLLLEDIPRVVNFSEDMTIVKNQSNRGTCAIFSTMGIVENAIKKDLKIDVNLSEEFLNFKSKDLGYYSNVEGSNVSYNLSTIKRAGLLLEKDLSYRPSYFDIGQPCEKFVAGAADTPNECFSHKRPLKETLDRNISAKNIEYNFINKDTNEIIKFLAKEQRGLTISLLVNYDGWLDSGETFYNEQLRAECLKTPSPCGVHSVVLTGYDLDKKLFYFKNSWGNKWGNAGNGSVSFETVDKYVKEKLYYVKVKSIEIPVDHDKDLLSVESLAFESHINSDKSVDIKVSTGISNALGRSFYVSSFLAYKSRENLEEANNDNSRLVIQGDGYVKAQSYFEGSRKTISLTSEAPLILGLSAATMSLDTVQVDILGDADLEAFIRTTIYVHTDTDNFKVLKQLYRPLAI